MKADVQPSPDKPKIALPTLSQINADRITLVSIKSEVMLAVFIRLFYYMSSF